MKKRISLDLDQDTYYVLKTLCFSENRSAANMLRQALLFYYENNPIKKDIDLAKEKLENKIK